MALNFSMSAGDCMCGSSDGSTSCSAASTAHCQRVITHAQSNNLAVALATHSVVLHGNFMQHP
jgi:hypothetical protein